MFQTFTVKKEADRTGLISYNNELINNCRNEPCKQNTSYAMSSKTEQLYWRWTNEAFDGREADYSSTIASPLDGSYHLRFMIFYFFFY